jgi:hypothetical protein
MKASMSKCGHGATGPRRTQIPDKTLIIGNDRRFMSVVDNFIDKDGIKIDPKTVDLFGFRLVEDYGVPNDCFEFVNDDGRKERFRLTDKGAVLVGKTNG